VNVESEIKDGKNEMAKEKFVKFNEVKCEVRSVKWLSVLIDP
jgi:hypothetical protein